MSCRETGMLGETRKLISMSLGQITGCYDMQKRVTALFYGLARAFRDGKTDFSLRVLKCGVQTTLLGRWIVHFRDHGGESDCYAVIQMALTTVDKD